MSLVLLILVGIYVVLIFGFFLGLIRVFFMFKSYESGHKPFVSIIVAFRNERQNLGRLLQQLCNQTYNVYEIVMVDDASDDGSLEFVKNFNCEKLTVFSLKQNYGKKAAIKFGLSKAKGQIIGFTDADCIVSNSWIEQMVDCMIGQKTDLCLGNVAIIYDKLLSMSAVQALEFSSLLASTAGAVGLNMPIMSNGANLFVKRELASKAELKHDLASGDDVFLLHYAVKNRRKIGFCPGSRATVQTLAQKNLHHFVMQRIRWASKASKYNLLFPKFVAIVVFLANLAIFISIFLSLRLFFELILIKTIVDLMLLTSYLARYRQLKLLFWLPIIEIFYIFYAVGIAILSQISSYEWKGRKYKTN